MAMAVQQMATAMKTPDKLVVWADSTYWGGENGKLVAEMVKKIHR